MLTLHRAVVVLAAISVAGCESSNLVQPAAPDAQSAVLRSSAASAAGKPDIDPTYANGTTVYMIGVHLVPNAATTMPNLYAHAEELYLVSYPQQTVPAPGALPITLPSGYQPQCTPRPGGAPPRAKAQGRGLPSKMITRRGEGLTGEIGEQFCLAVLTNRYEMNIALVEIHPLDCAASCVCSQELNLLMLCG